MYMYAFKRVLQFIPTIFFITLIMFVLLNILPGSAAYLAVDQRKAPDPELIARLEKEWGLDKPIHIRYLNYLKGLVTGDLGKSFLRKENVSQILAERIRPTLELAVASIVIAVAVGLPLGFISALRKGTWLDTCSMIGAVSGISIPQFWLGILLMFFFSVKLRIFPTSGYGDGNIMNLILPALSLGVGYMALIARTTRAAVIDVLNMDFVRTARSKGLSEFLVNSRHVFQNTMILVLTTVGLQFGSLIGATVVVEKLFSWPGIGSLLVDSIYQRDIPVTQGCILVIILIFLIVNLVVDLLYAVIDPRIKYQ
ncbi:MAG: ABC transporter permease [Desulfobacterales bacterium]|nr:ABC transporter permease [Desulfobacterales bacterium]